jgi:hypothetical protein
MGSMGISFSCVLGATLRSSFASNNCARPPMVRGLPGKPALGGTLQRSRRPHVTIVAPSTHRVKEYLYLMIDKLCCTDGENYRNRSMEGTIWKSARTVPGNNRIVDCHFKSRYSNQNAKVKSSACYIPAHDLRTWAERNEGGNDG